MEGSDVLFAQIDCECFLNWREQISECCFDTKNRNVVACVDKLICIIMPMENQRNNRNGIMILKQSNQLICFQIALHAY